MGNFQDLALDVEHAACHEQDLHHHVQRHVLIMVLWSAVLVHKRP